MSKLRFLVACGVALLLAACSTLTGTAASFPQSLADIDTTNTATPSLDIKRWTTANGSQVLFVRSPSLPMLDMQLTFAAGSSRDAGVPGLAALTSGLIGEGTQSGLDSDAIARQFDNGGARFSTSSYHDMGVIHLRTLTNAHYLKPNIKLLTQVLKPSFANSDINRIRTQMLQGLRMSKQVPGPQASKAFMKAIFGDHPYAHPSGGTLTSLPDISRQQLDAFYQQFYAAGNAVIALTGDISASQAKQLANRISNALPQGKPAATLSKAQPVDHRQLIHVPFQSSQTHILIGNQAIYRGVKDWPALYVGNWILGGGGFASRLTHRVREQKGYVYGISSSLSPMAAGGPFTISLKTANHSAQKALDLSLQVTQQFLHKGPTQAEVNKAIDHITGSFPLSLATNSQIVSQLGALGFYDLPSDYLTQFMQQIRQVTPAEVKAAMQKWIKASDFTIVSVGPKPLHWPTNGKTVTHEHQ